MCTECYIDNNRITPLRNPLECLQNHTQYICGTCGRCICIEKDPKRGLQRWNFPFQSQEAAKMYLRTADFTTKECCGIYIIYDKKGRCSYKILTSQEDLSEYLHKNKDKEVHSMEPVYFNKKFKKFPNTQIRKLTSVEINQYLSERQQATNNNP